MNPADIQIVDIGVNDADQAVPAPSTWAQSQADKNLTRAIGAADEIEMLHHKVLHLEVENKELTRRNDRQCATINELHEKLAGGEELADKKARRKSLLQSVLAQRITLGLRNEKLDLETTVHALRKLNSSQTDTILKLQTQHENQRETILELQRAAGIRAKPSQREYLRHELMDRASTMSNIFEAMIIDHPAIDPGADCFSTAVHNTLSDKINAAADALNNVYQFIGDEHL